MFIYKAPLYWHIASSVDARLTCRKNNNTEWIARHEQQIQLMLRNCLPHGSGINNGVDIDLDESTGEKLVFYTSFHHMDENGFYDGWTVHTITVTPSLQSEFRLRINGRNKNNIKEYLREIFTLNLLTIVAFGYDRATGV